MPDKDQEGPKNTTPLNASTGRHFTAAPEHFNTADVTLNISWKPLSQMYDIFKATVIKFVTVENTRDSRCVF